MTYQDFLKTKIDIAPKTGFTITKNRNGVIGEIELNWRGEWFLFENSCKDVPEAWR